MKKAQEHENQLKNAAEKEEKLKQSLVGKRKIHKEKGKEGGLGFTFKRLSNGLFEVSKLKDGGAATESGLLLPKDIVHTVDGVSCVDLGVMAFSEKLTGEIGSVCELAVQRKPSDDTFIVRLQRKLTAAPAEPAAPGPDLTPDTGAAGAKDDDAVSVTSMSSSKQQKCSLGFTFKQSSTKDWKISKIKEGGWAEKSQEVASGDILLSLGGKECKGLDLKQITMLLQGAEGSTVEVVVKKADSGEVKTLTATRLRTL